MQNLSDADWERLKQFADKLEIIVNALAKERERRKTPVPAQRGKQHIAPLPAQVTAGFLYQSAWQADKVVIQEIQDDDDNDE